MLVVIRSGAKGADALAGGRFSGELTTEERKRQKESLFVPRGNKVTKTKFVKTSAARKPQRCFSCNKPGHVAAQCRKREH